MGESTTDSKMRWTSSLLFVASMASAMPSNERTAKSFSLFSVVSFPNDECQTIMDAAMTGICVTTEECDDRSGTASGNCASGFGVCCFTMTDADMATISNTATYIQNPGAPNPVGATAPVTASTHTYMINGGTSIEQIRLDFQTAVLEQPTAATGLCTGTDTIALSQGSNTLTGFSTLCGTLTGQHIYLDHGTTAASGITIATSTTAFSRSWKILVRLLEADSPLLAPSGCRQFFTGETGTITSLNHVNGAAVGTILGNTNYKACIRMLDGNNCVTYREARSTGTPDAFNLANANGGGAETGATCASDAIIIGGSRFCGGNLSPVSGQTTGSVISSAAKPPGIRVVTTGAGRTANSAFEIKYAQKDQC